MFDDWIANNPELSGWIVLAGIFLATKWLANAGYQISSDPEIRTPRKFADWVEKKIENSPYFRLFGIAAAVIGFVVVMMTAYHIKLDLEDRTEERIARAWQIVTTKASGNSGKVQALEYLASQGTPLTGIDLSCRTMGGVNSQGKCIRRPWLEGLNLSNNRANISYANFSGTNLQRSNLQGATNQRGEFVGADLFNSNFAKTTNYEANFSGANLTGANLSDATFSDTDFTRANFLKTDFNGATFADANFSNAIFTQIKSDARTVANLIYLTMMIVWEPTPPTQSQLDAVWAWRDQPPIGLNRLGPNLNVKKLCYPELRERYEIEGKFGVPDFCEDLSWKSPVPWAPVESTRSIYSP